MANQKISQLTEQPDLSLIEGLAGYQGTSNVRISGPNIISAIPTMYSANSDLLEFRTVNDRTGGFTGTAGTHAIKFNFRGSGSIIAAGYLNNGNSGTANNLFRWGPGLTNGSMNVRGNLALSGGGGAISLVSSAGQQYLTMAQTGTTINTNVGFGLTTGVSARLHVKGSGSTSSTTSLLVENSLGDDILNIKDDGTFALGKGADSNLANNVCIGGGTQARNNSVVIGVASQANTSSNYSVALGYACYSNATRAVNIGMLSRSTGTNSITFATNGSTTTAGNVARQFAVHMSSSSTADFKVIANEGMVPPSITTVTRDAIASPGTGSTIYNTTDNKLQYYDGTNWQSPSSEPYLDVFNTSPASPDPLSIYNDGIIRIWLDESASDDIEVQVLTDPAASALVNFTWWSPTAGTSGRANINAASGIWQLNAGFNNNDVHQMSVFAPTDTSWPYYEVRIIKTDTAFTGVPAIIRVNKYTI